MTIPNRQKPVGAVMPLTIDWSQDLTRYESTEIVNAGWDVESGTITVNEAGAVFDETTTTVDVSGGTAGATNWIVASAITAEGKTMVKRVPIYVTKGPAQNPAHAFVAYGGCGAADLDAAGIAGLTAATVTSVIRSWTLSPTNQKVYFAWPKSLGSGYTVYLSGFEVDLEAIREVTISSVVYYVLESTNLLTGVSRRYDVRAT